MKTIKEWFESVENPILRKVLLMRYNKSELTTILLSCAVYNGIKWKDTIEGWEFWGDVWQDLNHLNESPTFNAKYPVMQVEWLDENECIRINTLEEAKSISNIISNNSIKESFIEDDRPFVYFPKINKITDMYTSNSDSRIIYPAKLFIMKNNLLNEAKRRFPIGTKFISAYSGTIYENNVDLFTLTSLGILSDKNYVYHNNQWAEYVEVYGFKIRDVLDKDILNESKPEIKIGDDWITHNKDWGWSPSVDKIEWIDNCICIKTNNNVWIKAEGLREFICNEKQEQSLQKELKFHKQIENKLKTMTELPKYFVIKRNENNPLWESYVEWLKQTYHSNIQYPLIGYFGYDGNNKFGYGGRDAHTDINLFKNNPTLITLEQWNSIVNKTQTNMKTQTLTLGQLKTLYNADNCKEWRAKIELRLKSAFSLPDNFPLIIEQSDLDYAKKHASKAQLKLLTDAGLVFEEECSYKVGEYIIFNNTVYKIINVYNFDERSPYGKGLFIVIDDINKTTISYNYHKKDLRKATQEEIDYASINWNKLKTGSVVMVKLQDKVDLFDCDKRVKVVFYNQSFVIANDTKDFCDAMRDDLITLCQNANYVVLTTDEFKQIISKVISY